VGTGVGTGGTGSGGGANAGGSGPIGSGGSGASAAGGTSVPTGGTSAAGGASAAAERVLPERLQRAEHRVREVRRVAALPAVRRARLQAAWAHRAQARATARRPPRTGALTRVVAVVASLPVAVQNYRELWVCLDSWPSLSRVAGVIECDRAGHRVNPGYTAAPPTGAVVSHPTHLNSGDPVRLLPTSLALVGITVVVGAAGLAGCSSDSTNNPGGGGSGPSSSTAGSGTVPTAGKSGVSTAGSGSGGSGVVGTGGSGTNPGAAGSGTVTGGSSSTGGSGQV